MEPFRRACRVLLDRKAPDTPVGVVREAGRDGETVHVVRLRDLPGVEDEIDMKTTIIVGNSKTMINGRLMVTPRGYDVSRETGGGLSGANDVRSE